MLIPNRFSNLKYCVLFMTSLIIDILNNNSGSASIDTILCRMKNIDKEYSRDDILSSVTLLFALGKVEYDSRTDNINYIARNLK